MYIPLTHHLKKSKTVKKERNKKNQHLQPIELKKQCKQQNNGVEEHLRQPS